MFNFKSKKFESDNESNKINSNNNNRINNNNNKIKFYPNNIFPIKQFKYNREEDNHPNIIKIKENECVNNININNNNKIILNFFDDDINPFIKKYLLYENNYTSSLIINNKINNFEKQIKLKNFNFDNINNTIKNITNNNENNKNNINNKLNKNFENIFILYTPNLIDNLNKLNWIFKIKSQIFIINNNENNNKIITQLFTGMNIIFLNSSNKIKNTIKIFSIYPNTIISTKGFKEDFNKKILNIQEYLELNINLFYLDNPAIYVENNNIFLILTLI